MTFLLGDPTTMLRTVFVGALAYVALMALLRISGKRTLSKMNAFDLVVTVALGSTLATILLSQDVPLLTGIVAFAVLIGLQWAITYTSVRSETVARAVKSEPRALIYRGKLLRDAMREERVVDAEIRAVIREHGVANIEDVALLVLETDGSFSVVTSLPEDGVAAATTGLNVPDRAGVPPA
jgi:uncharacterized membrane protein YcaP (DUF421 family)